MATFTVLNPATEQAVAEVAPTSVEATDAAIARAVAAQAPWRAVAPGERAALLRAFADAVDAHLEELAGLEVAGWGTRWGRPGGRPATSATCCGTTPLRRNGSAGGRSRFPAAWT